MILRGQPATFIPENAGDPEVAQWFSEKAPYGSCHNLTSGPLLLPKRLSPPPRLPELLCLDCPAFSRLSSLQTWAPSSPAWASPDLAKFLHFLSPPLLFLVVSGRLLQGTAPELEPKALGAIPCISKNRDTGEDPRWLKHHLPEGTSIPL